MPLEKNQPVDRNKRLVVQKRGYMSRAHATVHHTTLHASYTAFFFLEHTEELRIIILRRMEKGSLTASQTNPHPHTQT